MKRLLWLLCCEDVRVLLAPALREALERASIAWQILRYGGVKPTAKPKPPVHVEAAAPPAPPPGPRWQRITIEALDQVRGVARAENWHSINLCRGPTKGCDKWMHKQPCPDCYSVPWWERRPSAELLAAMERGDA